jgi:hypothetical protein
MRVRNELLRIQFSNSGSHGFTISPHNQSVIPRESGVSSTPRLIDSITAISGILDHPLEPVIGRREAPTRWRVMTVEGVACACAMNCYGFNFQTAWKTRLRDLAA